MKKLLLVLLLLSGASCGTTTIGTGSFDGTLADVSWEGVFFKSCEMSFQYGQQSSTLSVGSSFDESLCSTMSENVGKRIKVKYQMWIHPCCVRLGTRYEVLGILPEETKE